MRSTLLVALLTLATNAAAQPAPRWAAAVDSMMLRTMADSGTPGAQLAVVERGRVVYTKAYGVADAETGRPVTDRTLFETGSLTKLFTAALLTQLAGAGVVDLRAPISRWVPEQAGHEVGGVTLHELLTSTAGWGDNGFLSGRTDDAALGAAFGAVTDSTFVLGLRGIYSFSNPGWSMAGYVAERAGRRPFATLLDSVVLRPLGMPRSTVRPLVAMTYDVALGHVTRGGAPAVVRPMPSYAPGWPAGFLFTTAAEAARVAIALMEGGMLDGARVLPADAVRAITTAYVSRGGSPVERSGYGVIVDSAGGRLRWQIGGTLPGNRARLTMWPAERLAIVVLTNHGSEITHPTTDAAARLVAGIRPPARVAPSAERDPTAAERAALLGEYRLNRRAIQIHDANGRLELRRVAYSAPIRMTGTDRFVVTAPGGPSIEYVVVRDAAGAVRYLYNDDHAFPKVQTP